MDTMKIFGKHIHFVDRASENSTSYVALVSFKIKIDCYDK